MMNRKKKIKMKKKKKIYINKFLNYVFEQLK